MNDLNEKRPDPDDLLESIKEKERKESAGKLKIFFGMCAGVGKTYAMLEAAQKAKKEGINVVIGIVETHKRADTEELTAGLIKIPLKRIEYREAFFSEMDTDAIIAYKPGIVLVDELAHTNIPGSRHTKRYQDVLELLDKGIDVYATLNVQHLESRAEIVKQITGTVVRETLPDSVMDRADEIELIDITPDELLKRLAEGKVYTRERSKQAIQNFFRKGNLTALREMALRLTAERVDWQLRDYLSEKKISGTWKSRQRLLVAIGPSPYSAELIRWARRLAYSMESSWTAVYVETEQTVSENNKDQLISNFNLARELGAEVISTSDSDIAKGLIRVAKENNITQIIVGKPRKMNFADILFNNNHVKKLLNISGDIDVLIVGGIERKSKFDFQHIFRFHSGIGKYFISALLVCTIACFSYLIHEDIGYQTVALLFLLLIALLPLFNFGPGPILLAAFASALTWDYFFIPPYFTLHIGKIEDVLMLIMYFILAMVTGVLSARIRTQEKFVRQREKRTSALYNLSKELSYAHDINAITENSIKNIKNTFNVEVLIIYPAGANTLSTQPHKASTFILNQAEWNYADWVFKNAQKAGRFTNTLPLAEATYYPLIGRQKVLGVAGILSLDNQQMSFDQQGLFDTFIIQIAMAVEREFLNEAAKESFFLSESEKLYRTLFNSISHELKTPLTAIISASSSVNNIDFQHNEPVIKSLTQEISIAAKRLNTLVENLLDMARLETGIMKLKLDWYDIKDLIQNIAGKLKEDLSSHKFKISFGNEIKLFRFDFVLLEQAIINIIRNSILYSPAGSEIVIDVHEENGECVIQISDNGPGFPEEALTRVFDKFYRVPGTKTGGTGLGLSISKGFVDAHNGKIDVKNRNYGGALFTIRIPMEQ
jgi:two-component system sensor histidine kinase KdpD